MGENKKLCDKSNDSLWVSIQGGIDQRTDSEGIQEAGMLDSSLVPSRLVGGINEVQQMFPIRNGSTGTSWVIDGI